MPAAVDLHQKQAVQTAQASFLNRAANQRATDFYEHFERILARVIAFTHRRPPVLQQILTGKH